MKRCPVCLGLVSRKATRCKHCTADIREDKTYYEYLDNGFSRINKECDVFNQKIDSIKKGLILPKHNYSEEELLNSSHLDKIRAIAGKMGSDIENWQQRGKLSPELKSYYDERIVILDERFQFMIQRLKSRKYNIWERISEFFICSYYFIINIAFHHLKSLIIPYIADSKNIMKPFSILQKTADSFEHFLNEMSNATESVIEADIPRRPRKRA
jgi:hypothetical protein